MMFKIGQAVVHPAHGPGEIVRIKTLSTLGNGKQYYSIRL
jgi:RNA polymerase-interacting CarD/CdnL/TRCF family regulator